MGEYLLYGLVAASLIRWVPYRWWRLTHKLLGVPFAFACWHFYTAEKPYGNGSGWGWYFGLIMIVGLASYLHRVLWRDFVSRGRAYTVAAARRHGTTLEVELAPKGRAIEHRAGQFAVLKIHERGLTEPHPFTIASGPGSDNLRFFIRDLGDWSGRLQHQHLIGSTVLVEGPFGRFRPLPVTPGPTLWVAGGVGITPFLSAIEELPETVAGRRPVLIYCVSRRLDATAIEVLDAAAATGRIDLHVVASAADRRLSAPLLRELLDGRSLDGWHIAACGPAGLISLVVGAARSLGAGPVETEAFDIRSGIGPDLSRPLDAVLGGLGPAPARPGSGQPAGPTIDSVDPDPSNRKPSSVASH